MSGDEPVEFLREIKWPSYSSSRSDRWLEYYADGLGVTAAVVGMATAVVTILVGWVPIAPILVVRWLRGRR